MLHLRLGVACTSKINVLVIECGKPVVIGGDKLLDVSTSKHNQYKYFNCINIARN